MRSLPGWIQKQNRNKFLLIRKGHLKIQIRSGISGKKTQIPGIKKNLKKEWLIKHPTHLALEWIV